MANDQTKRQQDLHSNIDHQYQHGMTLSRDWLGRIPPRSDPNSNGIHALTCVMAELAALDTVQAECDF